MDNEQYLKEVQKALEKDTTRLGDVYQLAKKGKCLPEIAKELNISNEQAYSYWTSVFAIEEQKYMNHYCRKALANFFKRHHKDFSEETITELRVRREIAEKYGIAGIYVYTYPIYYKEGNRIFLLKVGRSNKDVVKRLKKQTTATPERLKPLQIWVDENDGDLQEIEKKIHDHLRAIGHGGPKRKEWFQTNEQSVASTANLLGLSCLWDHKHLLDNGKPKTDD